MTESEKLNMRLRSYVLEHSIRLEGISASIVKSLLRILKDKTKTLSNKSSSLSFKNKIDLLHDLGDIDDLDYNHLIKFMEIRNQFAHNHECSSFVLLQESNPEITKYLNTKFQNEESNPEKSLHLSYNKLFEKCLLKLILLEKEYDSGLELDFYKYIDHEIMDRIDTIFSEAIINWQEFNAAIGPSIRPIPKQDHIDNFIICLRTVISKNRTKIFDELSGSMDKAFQRKIPIEKIKAKRVGAKAVEEAKPKDDPKK